MSDDKIDIENINTPGKTARVDRAQSPESQALAQALKQRGWKFLGPTTVYAFMQAMGLVNDHAPGCALRAKAEQARRIFKIPQ